MKSKKKKDLQYQNRHLFSSLFRSIHPPSLLPASLPPPSRAHSPRDGQTERERERERERRTDRQTTQREEKLFKRVCLAACLPVSQNPTDRHPTDSFLHSSDSFQAKGRDTDTHPLTPIHRRQCRRTHRQRTRRRKREWRDVRSENAEG